MCKYMFTVVQLNAFNSTKMVSSKHEKDNRSLVQTVVALLDKLQEIEILDKYFFDTNENINNDLGMFPSSLHYMILYHYYNPSYHNF